MKTAHCVARFNIANCLGGVFKIIWVALLYG